MYSPYFQSTTPSFEYNTLNQHDEEKSLDFGGSVELPRVAEINYPPRDVEPSIQSNGALRTYDPDMASIPIQQRFGFFASGASAGAAQAYFPETGACLPPAGGQESPTYVRSSPGLNGYHGWLGSRTGNDYSQDQYADADETAQLDPHLQLADFETTAQLYAQAPFAAAGPSRDELFVDPSNPTLACPPAPQLPTTQAYSQTPQMPSLDCASGNSVTSLSPVTPMPSSLPPLGTMVEASIPPSREETKEKLATWMQPESPPLQAYPSRSAGASVKKRRIGSADIVDHSYSGTSSRGIGPRSAKRSRESSSGIATTVKAPDNDAADSRAARYGGDPPASSAGGDLRVSVAGSSHGPLATGRQEVWEQCIPWLRGLENKDLKSFLIKTGKMRTEKISGENRSKCCWKGCTDRPRRRPTDVIRHIRTAHLEQYATCALCQKVFRREDSRTRHMKTEHPQQYVPRHRFGQKKGKASKGSKR